MTNLLSTVSGFFSRALILGAFLPTVVFVAFFIWFVVPFLPTDLSFTEKLKSLGTEWQILSITFFTIVVSGLLYNLNGTIIRVYEGYPWKNTWIGQWLQLYYQKKFRKIDSQRKAIRSMVRELKKAEESQKLEITERLKIYLNKPNFLSLKKRPYQELLKNRKGTVEEDWSYWLDKIRQRRDDLDQIFLNSFPGKESLVLPTALGNVIRSFEYYPDREYGIDAIRLYPRLVAKLDKDYSTVIDDAKTSFDFMLNSSFLSILLALFLLIAGLFGSILQQSLSSQFIWLGETSFFLILSWLAYKGAILRAGTWGETVKSAFDLYRNALLQQLGYPEIPKTKKVERALWNDISVQMIYGDLPEGPLLDYNKITPQTITTSVKGEPHDAKLSVLRSARYLERDNIYQIVLTVRNENEKGVGIKSIVLTDTLPGNSILKQGSAKISEEAKDYKSIKVTGNNPYQFEIGELEFQKQKEVIYEIIFLSEKSLPGDSTTGGRD